MRNIETIEILHEQQRVRRASYTFVEGHIERVTEEMAAIGTCLDANEDHSKPLVNLVCFA